MFFLNLGYNWKIASDLDDINNIILLPSALTSYSLIERAIPECRRILLDPQLYLSGLDPEDCPKTCTRLGTYPWFNLDNFPTFIKNGQTLSDWEIELRGSIGIYWKREIPSDIAKVIKETIDFQVDLGCTHIILPSPLVNKRELEFSEQAEWIDEGKAYASSHELGRPTLATIAIDEAILEQMVFEPQGYLETIIDQVSARGGVDGVYIIVSQTHSVHPFKSNINALKTYLFLSQEFSKCKFDYIIVNFSDVFGLVCLGVGATGFGSGQSQALRRLSFEGFKSTGGGLALPKFYSHKVIREFLPESDLEKIKKKNLINKIADTTPYSEELLASIINGGGARDVPGWAESQSNLSDSQKHFLYRLNQAGIQIRDLVHSAKAKQIRAWLEDAEASSDYVDKKIDGDVLQGKAAPVESWLELFDNLNS